MVYDNSHPTQMNAVITVDTAANGGTGNWNYPLWPGWVGNLGLQIREQISAYLNLPIIPG